MCLFATRWIRLLVATLAVWLGGCIEVDEHRRYDADGVPHQRVVIKVDPQYEALVFAEIEKKLRETLPKGARMDSSQRIDGKAAFVIEVDGADAADVDSKEFPITFAMTSDGFMQRRYDFRLAVAKAPEVPVPYRLRVTLPGTISQTNGTKISEDTVEFNLTRMRVGASYSVSSSAWAFDLGSKGSPNAGSSSVSVPGWLMPASLASICAGIVALAIGWITRRRSARMPIAIVASAPLPEPSEAAAVATAKSEAGGAATYCTECGAKNPSLRKFCSACGQALG